MLYSKDYSLSCAHVQGVKQSVCPSVVIVVVVHRKSRCNCHDKQHVLSNSQKHKKKTNDSSLLLSTKQGPRMLEIVLFDPSRLLTTPSTALCIPAVSIAHAQAQYR